jgi:hypothetical protein
VRLKEFPWWVWASRHNDGFFPSSWVVHVWIVFWEKIPCKPCPAENEDKNHFTSLN